MEGRTQEVPRGFILSLNIQICYPGKLAYIVMLTDLLDATNKLFGNQKLDIFVFLLVLKHV